MSVLRQEGPSYLQRRLTKLYTDTKTHCENVATAARPDDDPELVALQRKFRTQTDRLLAWGLDWSDSKAAQPNDIDESITQAGFSDVVASVMSSIQNILNEADRLRQPEAPTLPPKGGVGGRVGGGGGGAGGGKSGDLPSKTDLCLQHKTQWTEEDIKRSHELLDDLTSCIDTLYELSESRRNMMASETNNSKSRSQTAGPKPSKRSKEPLRSKSYDSKSSTMTKGGLVAESPSEMDAPFGFPQQRQQQVEMPQYAYYAPETSTLPEFSEQEHMLPESFSATKHLHINRSALQLSGASHAHSPPPYEQVAQSTNSRIIGRIQTSATPFMTRLTQESTLPILVEFVPMMLEAQNSVTIPPRLRLDKLHRSLDQLVENSRVSHLGLLRFLGYYIDMANARYAFVYQMPIDYFPFLSNPSNLLKELRPKTLVSLFHTGDEHQDIPVPTLEARFRLAYNLLLAVLHLRSQNVVHGNINSSNIVVFPGLKDPSRNDGGSLVEDLRHPYLTSLMQFSGNEPTPEPLSASMYRHPDDKRQIDAHAAWAYDLYSLGLVLLEIGLWAPISRLWKMKYNNAMFKQRIENVYINKLGPKCGNTYLQIVQLCLDAPNFLLSTDPMGDLRLRLPCVFTYPRLELVDPESSFAFSTNFLFTLTKIMARCCAMDIFNPLPAEELDDCLPLAMERDFEAEPGPMESFTEAQPQRIQQDAPVRTGPTDDVAGGPERKVRKRTLKKLTSVEIPQEDLNQWNLYIMPKLSKYLQKILRDSSESCSASLMMTGESAEAAKPTICITCTNVKKVRCLLKRYFEMQPGWELVVLRGEITRSKKPRRRRPKPRCPSPVNSTEPEHHISDLNPHYQQRPLCGASIGAFKNEQHLPPVTYGGAILVDGVPYGMTVHHMLECPSDDERDEYGDDPPRSSAHWSGGLGDADDDFSYAWEDADAASHFEFEVTDDEDEGQVFSDYWVSDDEVDDDEDLDAEDDTVSIGDTAGVEPGDEPPLIVTQPALDDVHDDFFPSLEDRDDEHLASHTLGHVHASSGIRRWRRKGVKHEIDWALIRLDEHRLDPRNVIVNRSEGGHPQIHLDKVAHMEELGGLRVHCCGRTSGLQSGRISPAMTLVKLHGRESFSSSFCVDGNFGGKASILSFLGIYSN